LDNLKDLENIIFDFEEINKDIPVYTKMFFDLLRLKLKAKKYNISSIKRV
jgi:hypothetical protein